MYAITDPYEKISFDAMVDGSYFECGQKVYRKVKWEGEASYALDCEEGVILPPGKLLQDEFYLLVFDKATTFKFRRVIGDSGE